MYSFVRGTFTLAMALFWMTIFWIGFVEAFLSTNVFQMGYILVQMTFVAIGVGLFVQWVWNVLFAEPSFYEEAPISYPIPTGYVNGGETLHYVKAK